MGVWLDDEFPEHPKVEALDDDLARWLYVAGLCYANRNLTGGRIPKGAALRLTDKANKRLVDKLLAATVPGHGPLWEDHGDHYRIHNYAPKQQSAEKRRSEKEEAKRKKSEHARKAAEARWAAEEAARQAAEKEHESSMDRASPEHPPGIDPADHGAEVEQGDFLAPPPPQASAAARSAPGQPNALVPLDRSSSSLDGVGERPAEEEEDHGRGRESWDGHLVARLVAKRRLSKLTDPPPEGIRRNRWLSKTVENLLAEDSHAISEQLEHGVSVPAIVDLIEPPASPTAPADAAPWRAWEPPPEPDEPPATAHGLAGVRSALGGGA